MGFNCARATEAIVIVRIAKINSIFRIITGLLSSRERDIHDTPERQSQKEKLPVVSKLRLYLTDVEQQPSHYVYTHRRSARTGDIFVLSDHQKVRGNLRR